MQSSRPEWSVSRSVHPSRRLRVTFTGGPGGLVCEWTAVTLMNANAALLSGGLRDRQAHPSYARVLEATEFEARLSRLEGKA